MAAISIDGYASDQALVEIQEIDGTAVNVTTDVSSISISGFGRDTDSNSYFGGAKVTIEKPQEDGEISFDVRLTDTQWAKFFWGGSGSQMNSGSTQKEFRVSWLVTDDTTVSAANSATGLGSNAYRESYAECRCTAFEPSLDTDSILTGTITFKVSPTDGDGDGNVLIEANEVTTGSLVALSSYATGTKFR